jgi:DNA-binding response OmpR family regulator
MSAKRPILIVEDDEDFCQTLAEHLNHDGGFAVVTAASLEAADAALNTNDARFDAIILDIGLPDGDGRDYCARLRRQGHHIPVIMLTGADDEADVVRGLDSGANDYIVKPFRSNELLARLRTQLRLFENSEEAVFSVGPYTFRPSRKLLQDAATKRRIRLSGKEAAILKFLYRSDARPVDRQVLLREVWGYNPAVTTHTLETHIYRLRQKMEVIPANPSLLVTEYGGYRLNPRSDGSGGIASSTPQSLALIPPQAHGMVASRMAGVRAAAILLRELPGWRGHHLPRVVHFVRALLAVFSIPTAGISRGHSFHDSPFPLCAGSLPRILGRASMATMEQRSYACCATPCTPWARLGSRHNP